ncbi:MAG: hypothetical protein ACLP7P_08570 [Rhodomicrobium sp.]
MGTATTYTVTTVRQISDGNPDGCSFGQSPTDKISFYNATPVVQPSGAAQAAVTVTGTAATDAANAIGLANALRTALVNLGVIKGSA